MEPGETLAEAVEREVHEETGLRVRCGPLLGLAERIGPRHHYVILDFAVTVSGRRRRPQPGGDASAARWVALDALGELPLVTGLADFLARHGVIGRGAPPAG